MMVVMSMVKDEDGNGVWLDGGDNDGSYFRFAKEFYGSLLFFSVVLLSFSFPPFPPFLTPFSSLTAPGSEHTTPAYTRTNIQHGHTHTHSPMYALCSKREM